MFALVFKAIEDVTSYKVGIIGGNILASGDAICALATIVDVDIDGIIRKKVENLEKIIKAGEKVLGILEKIKKDLEGGYTLQFSLYIHTFYLFTCI